MKRQIYYYDTDCGGVVYHANYLNFFEEARTEALSKVGLTVQKFKEEGCFIVVNHQEIFYKYPAFYGDVLDVQAKAVELTPIRVVFEYEVKNQNDRLLSYGSTSLVCVDANGRPKPWPKYVSEKIILHTKRENTKGAKK
ncbi:MAG: acyl-CoA thioesterase [Elusimicrobiota bacterium]|jgi:acyl-CoA thioester hydrolase|nr:acyl-CoA thioesterase [Elusimicrobiota bacterium]